MLPRTHLILVVALLAAGAAGAEDATLPPEMPAIPAQPVAPAAEAAATPPPAADAAPGSTAQPAAPTPAAETQGTEALGTEALGTEALGTEALGTAPVVADAPPRPEEPGREGTALPQGGLMALVIQAHWVVQAVMAILALAAFAVLVVHIQKTAEYALAFRRLAATRRRLAGVKGLADAVEATRGPRGPAAAMIAATAAELELARSEPALRPGVRERTASALARIEAAEARRLQAGTGLLASVGALAPFVGLFGTVFGILNSFLAIAETRTTNLAVVAPGIAEALLATAIGLAAAVPAVLVHNICTRRLARFRHLAADTAAIAGEMQSRALDHLAAEGAVQGKAAA